MKVPANLPADRLILEYLSRVAAAGNRQLPKGKRMAFVSATRNRIWREIGPGGTADPDRVREALARLGEPEDLVMAERARLDAEAAERLERQARKKEAAEAAAAAASGTAPLQYRPRSPRPRPVRPAGPWRRRPSGGQGDTGTPQAPPETVTGSPAGTAGQAPEGTGGRAPEGTGGQAPEGTGGQAPEGTGGRGPGAAAGQGPGRFAHWIPGFADAQAPGGTAAPTSNGTGGQAAGGRPGGGGSDSAGGQPANGVTPAAAGAHQKGSTTPSGAGPPPEEETSAFSRGTHALRGAAVTLGNGAVDLALDAADLARLHKLETAAVLLLGVSGFIFVFPFWLVFALLGGVVAIWSQIWNARDKWVGLTGPPVIALVGTIVSALIIGGRGHFVGSYPEAFRLYVGYYYRAGSLLTAVYLALQARRGPQRRLPPWRR